ncbi:MAG: endonuclease/exonuclease/phosphatase family protein, partial [Bacteroidetes bacterium]|nr:endonuclease/exonuclease/phosphatase family protein [Bacteroidota bacterium]
AFDGSERRNKLRNRAEIKFWADYISGAEFIRDDRGMAGGLEAGAAFVILGDLNADPDEGSAVDDPIGTFLLSNEAVNSGFTPVADSAGLAAFPDLDPDDTAGWGMRVDYVLPSADIEILGGMIVRPTPDSPGGVSDHFPVYIDIRVGGS